MTPELRAMLDFIEVITYGVSTALMFAGLFVVAAVVYIVLTDR